MPYAAESILVTAAREAKKIWPFMAGMAVVGTAVVKLTASATPEVRAARRRRVRCAIGRPLAPGAQRLNLGFARGRARGPRALTRAAPLVHFAQDLKKSKFTNPSQH